MTDLIALVLVCTLPKSPANRSVAVTMVHLARLLRSDPYPAAG
jgi:hypothetical protein